MEKSILGFLQWLSRALFVLSTLVVGLLIIAFGGVFIVRGGTVPLDAEFLNVVIFGQELSEVAIEQLLNILNTNIYTATLTVIAICLMLLFAVLPVYLIKRFLLSLKPDQWFHHRNTIRLRYLSLYFFIVAVLDVLLYFMVFAWLEEHQLQISQGVSSWLDCFILGAGLLVLSYMHQHGVKLREEAELTV